jgi:uncharacterized protein (DUF302 family)
MAIDGLIVSESTHPVRETIDRVVSAATSRGLTVFARVDHAAGAAKVGMELRPTELVIFGNAKGGTPLMQGSQTAGIDLPLKMLAWEDAKGTVRLGYNDVIWIANRHDLDAGSGDAVKTIAHVLSTIAKEAV